MEHYKSLTTSKAVCLIWSFPKEDEFEIVLGSKPVKKSCVASFSLFFLIHELFHETVEIGKQYKFCNIIFAEVSNNFFQFRFQE
jgi:hypothetical protein